MAEPIYLDTEPEEFCPLCFAGTASDEHHGTCVMRDLAIDGEPASLDKVLAVIERTRQEAFQQGTARHASSMAERQEDIARAIHETRDARHRQALMCGGGPTAPHSCWAAANAALGVLADATAPTTDTPAGTPAPTRRPEEDA